MATFTGTVFDIRQFSVFDGDGIRTTVFLKGCPLQCQWCHNPEGLAFTPSVLVNRKACTRCGACEAVCPSPDNCIQCGLCLKACQLGLRRMCGELWESNRLAELLLKDRDYLTLVQGGVTFSGGEPLAQAPFLLDVLSKLDGMNVAIETSGFSEPDIFQKVADKLDFLLMDVKLMDPGKHRHFTGRDNRLILDNLRFLKGGGIPYIIRIPLIPGITDTTENLTDTAKYLEDAQGLIRVELLPYHYTAGAKYEMTGMTYSPEFDILQKPNADVSIFTNRGIPCMAM